MRDKVKRFISILMTALMLVNLLPVGALAEGIASIGYKPETVANYNGIVYVYVKVTGNTDGLVLNKDGWYTIGTVSIDNMPDPSNYKHSDKGKHVNSVELTNNKGWLSASDVSGINPEKNMTIPLDKVTWTGSAGGRSFGFVRVDTGATDYVGSGWTWHLDGYVNVKDVQAKYTVRYVDQDTGIVLQTAGIGTGELGSTISHKAQKTVAYNGKDYTRQGEQDQTFMLVSPTNTFDIDYRRPYGYTVEYYYDGVKDDKKTETGSAWCKDVIEEYIDKTPVVGYEHEKTENLPLTIGTDESKNVIKVYYKKTGHTVTYAPGEHGAFEAKAYNAKYGDATPAFDGETTGKPGWTFDGWEPKVADTVTENATYIAKFVPDETKKAAVLYTISLGQSDYGSIAPSAQQIILQATGKLASGDPISGSTATANKGYKFVGWYKVTGWTTEWITEWITDKPELTPELAEQNLTRNEQGLYQNTVFAAKFEPDENDQAEVIYQVENGTILNTSGSTSISQFVQVVTGEVLTDVEATPNKGYKFDGWYKGDERITTDLTLTPKMAKDKLDKDENGLYVNTTFTAKCVLDEDQNATVLCTIDKTQIGYGTVYPSIYQTILQATGKLANGDPISGSMATANPGYKFVGWYKVTGEETYEKVTDDPELTSELAESKLNRDEKTGLYRNTVFVARFELDDYAYTVEHYWIGDKDNPDAQPFHTDADESQTAPYGSTVKYEENGASWVIMTNPVYTFAKADPEKITISADASQNVLKLYYYKNVKLIANSETNPYNGKEQHVSGYTCAVAEMKDGRLEYVPWTGEKPLTFEGISASGRGKDVNENGYPVTFNDTPIGENNGLYYVSESQTGTLTITPAPVTLQAPIASKTYDGTPLKAEDYGHSFVEGLDFADDFASISVDGSQTMVGSSASSVTYELKQGKIPNNYNIQCIPGTLTITPVTDEVLVEIKGNTASVTYDGQLHKVDGYDASSISNSLYTANDFTYNGVAKAEGTDAATYPMNLAETRFENTNTNFKNVRFEVVTDGSLTISKRPVTLTSADLTKVYDGTVLTNGDTPVTVGGDGFADGEGATYDFTGSQTDVGKSANTFTYKPNDNTKADNYTFEVKFGTLEVTPVTDKVTVTIKGGKSSVTYNGEEHTVSGYKVSDISNPLYTANDFSFSGTAEAKGKNAGLYKMGLKAADFANTSNNFTNVEFVVADGQLEITKRPVTLTSANLIKVYDGTPLTNGDTPVKEEFGTEDAFPKGEGVTYTFKGSQTNAGSSKNTFTYAWNEGTNKDNYTIYQVEGDLVVTPIDGIKVTITGRKDTQTYDGKEHFVFGFDAEPSNALYNPKEDMQFNGTDVDMTAKGTDAGQYDIGLTAEDFTNKSDNFTNVTFVVTDGYVKITPRAVTLTSETAGKTYDGTALTKPVVTVGGDGFVEGQVKEIKATGSVTNAGSVANTITFTPNKETFKESNYAITKNEGTLTINKRSVLITSQSATKTYDGSALTRPAVTITGDGFVPGELAKAEATGSITNVGSTPNAIQYTTTGAFNPANYSIALSVGTLTVTAKPEPEPRRTFNLTVNYVYQNGKRAAASYNRGGLKNGETFDITSPVIAGYTASETVVSGTIDNRDIKVTVIYTADGVNLDDYGVPLGLGNITMNVGDCFE